MTARDARTLMESKVSNRNLRKHMYAAEACLRALARRFGEDEETWALAGILHDLDYDVTTQDPARHGLVSVEWLKDSGLAPEILHAIEAHVGHVERVSRLDRALFAVDPLTGLIVASALMHPTRKLTSLDAQFVLRRFEEKRFAAGANRDHIKTCVDLGLSLEEFVTLCLAGMTGVSAELGL